MNTIKRRNFIKASSLLFGSFGLSSVSALADDDKRDPNPPFRDEEIYLWPDESDNNGSNVKYRPKIRFYYPALRSKEDYNNLPAVLICPGGGYHIQAYHEGAPFARLFALHGIIGVVLTYRVYPDGWPAPYADATRAMRILRRDAEKYAIDPERIGIMGFSAGGHLASTVATQPDIYKEPEDKLTGEHSARPDRAILGYPVISFTEFRHEGSAKALLGETPDQNMLEQLSNQKQVNENTPPSFLVHAANDKGVPVQNSMAYAQACIDHDVPVELHVFPSGGHGFGMALNNPAINIWSENLMKWLQDWTLK